MLLRHGRTAWNAQGRAQGHADVTLDATGQLQAKQVAPAMAQLRPVALYSSDLQRACQTAQAIAETTGLSPQLDARLREYDVGQRQGITAAEFAQQYPQAFAQWQQGLISGTVPGGETPVQVRHRMAQVLTEIYRSLEKDEVAVVVSHGAAIRTAVTHLLGLQMNALRLFGDVSNCGWVRLTWPQESAVWKLLGYNEQAEGLISDPDFTIG